MFTHLLSNHFLFLFAILDLSRLYNTLGIGSVSPSKNRSIASSKELLTSVHGESVTYKLVVFLQAVNMEK